MALYTIIFNEQKPLYSHTIYYMYIIIIYNHICIHTYIIIITNIPLHSQFIIIYIIHVLYHIRILCIVPVIN